MPRQVTIPSQTYPVGSYGPFTVNNLDPADKEAYLIFGGGTSWGAAFVRVSLEARVGNDPWFSLGSSESRWLGDYTDKHTGQLVTQAKMVVTLPYVGQLQRDLRAIFEVVGDTITTPLTAGTR